MNDDLTINKRLRVTSDASTVWSVLTSPEHIVNWLGTDVTTDWEEGAPIVFSFTWEGTAYEDKGEILRFEPERTFSYSYWSVFSGLPDAPENYSTIEFQIVPDGESVVLELRHSGFANRTMFEHSDANWDESLQSIKSLSESH